MTWQIVAALAVPLLGFLGALFTSDRDPGGYRRLKRAAEALAAVPAESKAVESLEGLVIAQANALKTREEARNARQLNVMNLTLSIILTLGGAGLAFLLWNWSASAWGTPLGWLVVTVSVLGGLFIALLIGAAFAGIYNPPAPKRDKSATAEKPTS